MTDQQDKTQTTDVDIAATDPTPERFPELAEMEEKIQRRLRSNQRFLERFMDEDFDDLEDDDPDEIAVEDDPALDEEL